MQHTITKYTLLFVVIALLSGTSQISYACNIRNNNDPQKEDNYSVRKLKRTALYFERNGNKNKALNQWEKILEKKPDYFPAIQRMAMLHFELREYAQACFYFEKLAAQDFKKYKNECFFYAKALMTQGKYNEALVHFEKLKKNPRGLSNRKWQTLIRTYIKACENNLGPNPENYTEIITVWPEETLNTDYHDVNAKLLGPNSLLYSSYTIPPTGKFTDFEETPLPHRCLMLAKQANGKWMFSKTMEYPWNEPNIDSENGAYNQDQTKFYFTRNRKNWKGDEISEIYFSELTEGQWSFPTKLPYPINDENYTNTQPAIGEDIKSGTEILYFVSNRPKGCGGMDIWFCQINPNTGAYSKPRNAGRKINTAGNEITPFYNTKHHEFFFSSNGHEGFGGYDIYKTKGSTNRWMKAQLLKKPINSSFDDLYFSNTDSRFKGFFSSNRPTKENNETCCEDIYGFTIEKPSVRYVCGKVENQTNEDFYDVLKSKMELETQVKKNGEPLNGISVALYQKDENGKMVLINKQKTNADGMYFFDTDLGVDYEVTISNLGFFDKKRRFSTKEITSIDTLKLKPVGINYIEPNLKLRYSIFFEFGKNKLVEDSKVQIDTTIVPILQMMPNAIIEIGSHTDNIGSESYNLKLSQKRAENVQHYLFSKGIPKSRVRAKGYGESFPIAPNTLPDGSDNPEGRKVNRRTEIRIVGSLSSSFISEDTNQ
jgi:outer membrane protein OmpA-like peptidoglycan-associated protein/tetratricopeptide (TPR) repeat protein